MWVSTSDDDLVASAGQNQCGRPLNVSCTTLADVHRHSKALQDGHFRLTPFEPAVSHGAGAQGLFSDVRRLIRESIEQTIEVASGSDGQVPPMNQNLLDRSALNVKVRYVDRYILYSKLAMVGRVFVRRSLT